MAFSKVALATAVAVVLVAPHSAGQNRSGLVPAHEREPAPNFLLEDSNGAAVRLSDFRGRVVLLDFWATWCTGCKLEMPWFEAYQARYAAQGLRSIGIAMDDEGWAAVKPFLAKHPIRYPIVAANADVAAKYKVTNLPVTVLVDRMGRIADSHLGVVDKEAYKTKIQQLLREAGK